MSKSHLLTAILAVVLFILNIILITYRKSDVNNAELNEAKNKEIIASGNLLNLKNNYRYELESEYCKIARSSQMLSIEGDTILLSEIIKEDQSYLVFRYSFSSCESCIEQITRLLFDYKDTFQNIEIILLPHYESYRNFVIYNSDIYNRMFRMMMPITNQIGLPIDV